MRALRGDRERGAAAVEFALIVTPLLILVFAIIGFGWGFSRWVALQGGAREGVRHLAIHGSSTSSNPEDALGQASALAIESAPLACGDGSCTPTTPSTIPCSPGTDIVFRLSMAEFSPIPLPFIPDLGFPKTAEAVMRCGG